MKTPDKNWTQDSHRILEQATNLYYYNHWLVDQFRKYFGKSILEIGSGLGGLSNLLPKDGLTLSDIRDDYLQYLKKELGYKTFKINIEKEAPGELNNKFDSIFSSNVFEHIKDDQSAFNNSYKLLKPKGKLLLFIPARQEIYGVLDHDMGHYRRYSLEDGVIKAKKAGFKIVEAKYVNLPGYFAWWGRGVLLGKIIHPKEGKTFTDNFLAKIYDLLIVPLISLEKFYHPPFGQNLFMVLEKP
jgi:SAM-dependent methyltransferase